MIPGLAAAEWPSRWFVPPELGPDERRERVALQLPDAVRRHEPAHDRLALLSGGRPCEPVARTEWALDVRSN